MSGEIRKGALFDTFKDFEAAMDRHIKNSNHKYERRNSKTLECCWLNGSKKDLTTMGYKKELVFYEATYKCEREKTTKCPAFIRFGVYKKSQLIIKSADESHNHQLQPTVADDITDMEDNFQTEANKAINGVMKRLAEHMDSTPADERHKKLKKINQLLRGWENESSKHRTEESAGGSQHHMVENEDNGTPQVNPGNTTARDLPMQQCDDGVANAHSEETHESDVPIKAKSTEKKSKSIDKVTHVTPSLPDTSLPDSLADETDSDDDMNSIFEKIKTVPFVRDETQQTIVRNPQKLNFNDLRENVRSSTRRNSTNRRKVTASDESSSTRTPREEHSDDSISTEDASKHEKTNSKNVEEAARHDLRQIKMPGIVASKGRPLGTKTTTVIGLRRYVKKPIEFEEKPRITQIEEMLQWLNIPPKRSAMILKGENRIKAAEINCDSHKIRDSFAESDIDILQKYMESSAFARLKKIANAKKAANIWTCEQCVIGKPPVNPSSATAAWCGSIINVPQSRKRQRRTKIGSVQCAQNETHRKIGPI